MKHFPSLLLAAVTVLAANAVHAQDNSALLNLLVKKKLLTEQEAQDVRGQLEQEYAATSASKFQISKPVTELRLYGDAQLRYGIQEGEAAGLDTGDHGQRDRLRYRLHLGAEVKLVDHWLLGVQVETSNDGRSTQVTAGDNPFFGKGTVSTTSALTSVSGTSGPVVTGINTKTGKPISGKALTGVSSTKGTVVSSVNFGDTLFVSKVFLRYSPADWLSLEGGKIPNPFVTTPMVWDPDLNPEGLAEQFQYTIGPSGSGGPVGNNGKSAVAPHGLSLDVFANFGQFVYDEAGFENSFNNTSTTPFTQVSNKVDNWMLGWQIGARAHFTQDVYLQVAPTLYNYTGGGQTSATVFNGDSPAILLSKNAKPALVTFNQTGVNNLNVLDIPVEFGWKIGNVPFTIFGDFADNLNAGSRAARAGHPDKGNEGIAYQVGASIGKLKRKGDWELRSYWQHSEQFSLDPNLVDNNVFDGRLNTEGYVISLGYAFTDAASLTLIYSRGEQIDRDLGTAGYGSLVGGGTSLRDSQFFFADFLLKF